MSCLQTPRLYSVYSILYYFSFLLKGVVITAKLAKGSRKLLFIRRESYTNRRGFLFFIIMTTRLISLFLFYLSNVLYCYLSPFLYQFSLAALTNYYRNNTGQKSNTYLTGLKLRCQQGCLLFLRLKGRIHFLAFSSFQELPSFLGLLAPFHLQSQQWKVWSFLLDFLFSLSLASL